MVGLGMVVKNYEREITAIALAGDVELAEVGGVCVKGLKGMPTLQSYDERQKIVLNFMMWLVE